MESFKIMTQDLSQKQTSLLKQTSQPKTSEEEKDRWHKWWRSQLDQEYDHTLTSVGIKAFQFQDAYYLPLLAQKDSLIKDLHQDIIRKDKEAIGLASEIDALPYKLAKAEERNQRLVECLKEVETHVYALSNPRYATIQRCQLIAEKVTSALTSSSKAILDDSPISAQPKGEEL